MTDYLLNYCYKSNITKLLDIYIKHSKKNNNIYFESIFALLKDICDLFICTIEFFINKYNDDKRKGNNEQKRILFNKTKLNNNRVNNTLSFVSNSKNFIVFSGNGFINFHDDEFKINDKIYSQILEDVLNLKLRENIFYCDVIFRTYAMLLDVYAITNIYDNIIDGSKETNFHCMVLGNNHTKFIHFCFNYVSKFMKPNLMYKNIPFYRCNVNSESSKYININQLYYPIDKLSKSTNFRKLD